MKKLRIVFLTLALIAMPVWSALSLSIVNKIGRPIDYKMKTLSKDNKVIATTSGTILSVGDNTLPLAELSPGSRLTHILTLQLYPNLPDVTTNVVINLNWESPKPTITITVLCLLDTRCELKKGDIALPWNDLYSYNSGIIGGHYWLEKIANATIEFLPPTK